MKLVASALLSATLLVTTQAHAEMWVQYDVFGSGSYSSTEIGYDPPLLESGHASFSGTFFVEVDPTNADDFLNYSSDGKSFSQWDWYDPTLYYAASAGNGTLSFSYQIIDGDCGHEFCEDAEITLKFAPGSFDAFPTALPHLSGGDINVHQVAHWWGLDASGSVWSVRAKLVSAPGQSSFGVGTTPTALPEPASWALMLGGFGICGGAMRLRRKTFTFA